ncbi:hypothetical protein HZB04_00290 [Candidatus Wolfebacteria bacterium]|nr:hypothetical protein [Candidatus Wolfebacteria bacterium]
MEIEQENLRKKKIHLIETFAFLAVLVLGTFVYFFAKSPGRQTEFVAQQNDNQAQINQERQIKPIETPKETFIIKEDSKIAYGDEKISASQTQKLPESAKFKTFSYDPKVGKIIEVAGACSDIYYAIIVFKATDNYKTSPALAKVNNALECPANRIFKTILNLGEFNLSTGEYYFFVADQGKTGTWYNPR